MRNVWPGSSRVGSIESGSSEEKTVKWQLVTSGQGLLWWAPDSLCVYNKKRAMDKVKKKLDYEAILWLGSSLIGSI